MSRARRTLLPVFSPLLSRGDFSMLLRKAEERSLRSGTRYALIILSPAAGKRMSRVPKSFIRYVFGRIRTTDDIGYFDEHRIGILLPGAERNGVEELVRDIRAQLGSQKLELVVTVNGLGKPESVKEVERGDFPDSLYEA